MTGSSAASHWFRWWDSLSLRQKALPGALMAIYWAVLALLGDLAVDKIQLGILMLILAYGGAGLRRVGAFILPLFLTGVVYDSQRYWGHLIERVVHVREPYEFDRRFFGIQTDAGVLTPNEWWQLRTHPVLDLICGFYYLTFIGLFVLTCFYFWLWIGRKGSRLRDASYVRARAPLAMWTFFWVNVLGYSTYYWYAAAPPWYVAIHGLGPVNLDALPSAAGAARFDALLGYGIFAGMYSKSVNVFGAIPSLHISYPLVACYFAFRFGAARVFTLSFYLIMCFAAVYLNHHYVLDLIWGSVYALGIAWGMDRWFESRNPA